MTEDARIEARLMEVFNMVLCPIAGCWPLRGADSDYYFDTHSESLVLEVWPIGIEEPGEHEGNGHLQTDLLYELAEFDFTELVQEVHLEHFHYSQRRAIFELGWEENGQHLELRIHLVPIEIDEG